MMQISFTGQCFIVPAEHCLTLVSLPGPSVYLKISSWNAGYAFKIDERNVQEHGVFSSRTTLTNCTYFSWTGTPGTHSLAVYVYGYAVSSSFSARDDIPALDAREAGVSESEGLERRDGGEWSFEINEVMYVFSPLTGEVINSIF